jgi:hypothetical protein
MNKKEITEIEKVIQQLKNLPIILNELTDKVREREKIQIIVEELKELEPVVEDIMYRHRDKADNLTDKARETYKGENIEKTADYLQDAFDKLTDCINNLEYSIGE